MKTWQIPTVFTDARGFISDILKHTIINHVTIIHSKAGAIRGNHYHNQTIQYEYLVSGQMRVKTPDNDVVVEAGTLIMHEPGEPHAYEYLRDSVMLVMTIGMRGGENYETDTIRLETPLL